MLAATVDGVDVYASDQNSGCGPGVVLSDTNPVVGVLGLGTTTPVVIGGFQVSGSVRTSIKGAAVQYLEQLLAATPVTATVVISDTN